MKLKLVCSIILGLACSSAFAIQEFTVGNNAEIDAIISDHDVSRIAIAGARISQVKLSNNQLKIDKDEENGQIFIYPRKENHPVITTTKIGNLTAKTVTGSMISVFIIDENGNSYNLRLRMQSVPSETILIRPMLNSKNNASTDFTTQLVSMTEIMYLDRKNEDGYMVISENIPLKLWKEVSFELYKTYSDDQFRGSVFILQNISDKTINLTEKQFWKPNTVSVAIENPVLVPNQITKIFVIGAKQDE